MLKTQSPYFLIALSLLWIMPGSADELSPALVDSWKTAWQKEADELDGSFLSTFGEELISTLDAENREPARIELDEIMQSAISWERLCARSWRQVS